MRGLVLSVNDVKNLLILAHQYDQRHDINEVKIAAWYDLLRSEAPDIDYEWARMSVQRHYATLTEMFVPSMLIKLWRNSARLIPTSQPNHCGRPTCACTHECMKGWIDRDDGTATAPCPVCRPELHDLLMSLPPRGRRGSKANLIRVRN